MTALTMLMSSMLMSSIVCRRADVLYFCAATVGVLLIVSCGKIKCCLLDSSNKNIQPFYRDLMDIVFSQIQTFDSDERKTMRYEMYRFAARFLG